MDKEYTKMALRNAFILCKIKGIKIGEMEKSVGISQGYLSRLKNRTKAISFDTMVKISKHLDVSLDSLLEDEFTKIEITLSVSDLLNGDCSKYLRDLKGKKNE